MSKLKKLKKKAKIIIDKKNKIEIVVEKTTELDGLNQSFRNTKGQQIYLHEILKDTDWWKMKSKNRVTIIVLHEAVKKIADIAGISTNVEYSVLTQPSYANNYQYLIQAKICDHQGQCTTELGEVNRSNLGNRGKNNPANMAQKRAFDRAVFRHIGITGLLGEDEIEEDNSKEMEKLSPEDSQKIAPLINELLNAKSKEDLSTFSSKMKKEKTNYLPQQLDVLRGLWKKKLGEFSKTF